MSSSVHWIVHGRVQGVGFRWFARDTAQALQLTGWVKNLPDRTVELVAYGSQESLQELAVQLYRGNGYCLVENLQELPVNKEDIHGFEIRH